MSCHSNEILKENILMGVLDMEESDLLVDALVEKRYDEDPRQA